MGVPPISKRGEPAPESPELAVHPRLQSRNASEIAPKFRVGGAEVDLVRGAVRAPDGAETELRRQSAAVLRLLVARRGETVRKEAIYDAVWGDIAVTEDSMVQCIGDIRRALGDARDLLRTVPREGYRLERERAARPAASSVWRVPARLGAVALAALLAVAGWMALDRREHPPAIGFAGPVVAVLPFENLSGGDRWDRLARGLTQDVIADLAQNAWLYVLADASAGDDAGAPPREIAAKLGAGHVVKGTVQAEADRVRISASLVDETGRQVWSQRWEGATGELLPPQREAAEALATALAPMWTGPIAKAELARAKGRGTDDLTAYELSLLGVERVHRHTAEDVDAAISLFEQAVRLDPQFGDAWAYLAFAYYNKLMPDMPPEEARRYEQLRDAAALEAYRVSPDLPKPIAQAAEVIGRTDRARAERMYRRAASLVQGNADLLGYIAGKAPQVPGMAAEAETWVRRAIALKPGSSAWPLGNVLLTLGRYSEAAAAYQRADDFVDVHALAAATHALAGEDAAARAALARALGAAPDFTIGWFLEMSAWDPGVEATVARGLRLAGAPERGVLAKAGAAD